MRKDIYLQLREIAISEGYIANILNDELVIYFFQEESNDMNDSIRIHSRINQMDLELYFSFMIERIEITPIGEEKLTQLFSRFCIETNFKGIVRFSHKADSDCYDLKYTFYDFLEKQRQTLSTEQLDDLSNKLIFNNSVILGTEYCVKDLTNTFPYLDITNFIRSNTNGQILLFQSHNKEQYMTFNNVGELATFLNESYEKANKLLNQWSSMIGADFSHSFYLDNYQLVFNQSYFSAYVNESFIKFVEKVKTSKDELLKFVIQEKKKFDEFLFNHPDLVFEEFTCEAEFMPYKDSISFNLLKTELLFLNKRYQMLLSFEPMMNGFVLKAKDTSMIYNLYVDNDFDTQINNLKYIITSFFKELYDELSDATEIVQLVNDQPILNNDSSFVSLVGPGLYRYKHIPNSINTSLISIENSLITTSLKKQDFIYTLKKLVKLDNLIKEHIFSLIQYFNYSRKYERNQAFLAFRNDFLDLATPVGDFCFKFQLNLDGAIQFSTIRKSFKYPLNFNRFFETTASAIEAFEKQIVLTYLFSSNVPKYDILSKIFVRYTGNSNTLYDNRSTLEQDIITAEIEDLLRNISFEFQSFDDFDHWTKNLIHTFLRSFSSSRISITYNDSTGNFLLEDK